MEGLILVVYRVVKKNFICCCYERIFFIIICEFYYNEMNVDGYYWCCWFVGDNLLLLSWEIKRVGGVMEKKSCFLLCEG